MKEVEKCVSKGISEKISPLIYNELFELAKSFKESTDLQVFKLSSADNGVLMIQHSAGDGRKAEVHLMLTAQAVMDNVVLLKIGNTQNMLLDKESKAILKRYFNSQVVQ